MSFDVAELTATAGHILTPKCDLGPKRLAMIEMLAMAEFVNNNVPRQVKWEELEFVMKIEIPLCRTTAPTALRVLDRHTTIRHTDAQRFICNHRY